MANYSEVSNLNYQPGTRGDQLFRDARENIEAHARGMWRYRWQAVTAMWIVSVIGWIFVYTMPPVYEANARIYVDTENAIRPLLQGIATSSDVMSEVTVVTREMLSRPNLAEVARATDLDLRADNDAQFESLLGSLQKRIRVRGNRENIFSISYQDADRATAVAVVDSLVNTFVEKSLGADRSESSKAQSFLQEQISEYEARLTAAEDKLARFKRENMAFMPGQRGDYFGRMQNATLAAEATRGQLKLAEERRDELMRQLEGEEPVFGLMPSSPQDVSGGGFAGAKIRELEQQLAELRLQYTDKHPRIGQILETIELLKSQQAEQRGSIPDDGESGPIQPNPLDLNPVYQNMRIQLTNTQVEIASLRKEYEQHQRVIRDLRAHVDTVPQVEAELGRLNRDYGVVKTKYEALLTQLETANIGEDVEESIDDVQFRIIDPPFAGRNPAGPKRQLLLGAILFVALGLGFAISFILNQLHPTFFTGRSVTAATGLPILGAVSLLLSPQEIRKKRRGRLQFATAVGVLFISFVLVSTFASQLSPLVRSLTGGGV